VGGTTNAALQSIIDLSTSLNSNHLRIPALTLTADTTYTFRLSYSNFLNVAGSTDLTFKTFASLSGPSVHLNKI